MQAVIALCLQRLEADTAWLIQCRCPSRPSQVEQRYGPPLPELPPIDRLRSWYGTGEIRALPPDAPELLALGLSGTAGKYLLVPIAVGREPRALLLIAGTGLEKRAAVEWSQGALGFALEREEKSLLKQHILAAVEQSADPLELTDKDAILMYVNQAWQKYTGYSAAEAVGQGLAGLLRDPGDQVHDTAFYAFTMDTLQTGKAWTGAMVSRSKSGEQLLQEVTVSPVVDEAGTEFNLATRRDIQHRARRESALMRAHQEFRNVLASMPDGVAVLQEGRIYFANDAFLAILDRPMEEVVGRALSGLVDPEWPLEGLDDPNSSADGGPRPTRFARPDGTVRFCEITSAGRVSFEGKPGSIVVARDVSEHKIAQEQLALADRLAAMGALAAGVAHEINNPLAYVLGNLEFLREGLNSRLSGPEREALGETLDGVQRIRRIVADLKSFSRRDQEARLEAVDASAVLTAASNLVLNEVRHRAKLVLDFEPRLAVLGEEGRLLQVFVNLLLNAAHAIPEGDGRDHQIKVSSRRLAGGRIALAVQDSGSGIPSAVLSRVFEPFFTTKERGVGSGLGLPISQRIIRDFDGEILIASTEGVGTTVTVELSEVAPPISRPIGVRAAPLVNAAPGRLLIVDDEPGVLRALGRLLRDHTLRNAESADAALTLLEEDPEVDLIFCDVMMPGMTGVEFHEIVTKRWPQLSDRFVFTTGGTFTAKTTRFFEGQARTLEKPFDPERVRTVVRDVLGPAAPHPKEG